MRIRRSSEGLSLVHAAALLASVALAPSICGAEPLLWPMRDKTCVTGSFGEYRTGHFHAGIDLSTNGRIGLPVRAVARGRVVRLRASPYGYGRAIYVDIDGGRQVVYGHLSAFAPRWQELVEAEQERLGKYTVDFAVADSGRVAAGEVIAYTGDSGGGPPHLHFEVREGDTDPINPLTHGWEAADRTPPVIRALRLVPLGLEGRVDGGLDPVVVRVARAKQGGVFRAAGEHTIRGRVGVEVLAEDRGSGCEDARAIYGAALSVGDSVLFETRFEQVSYLTDWSEVDVRYDSAARAEGRGNFMRLFEPIGSAGALADTVRASDVAKVSVRDAAGNEARAEISLRTEPAPEPDSLTSLSITHVVDSDDTPPRPGIDPHISPQITWRLSPAGLIVRLGWDPTVTEGEKESVTVFANGDRVPLRTLPAKGRSTATVWYVVPADSLLEYNLISVSRKVSSRKSVDRFFQFRLVRASRSASNDVRSHVDVRGGNETRPGDARLVVPQGALYQDELLTGSVEPDAFRLPAGIVSRAEPARFEPSDLLLKQRAEVRFAIPDSLRPIAERLAVYSVAPDGSVDCLGGMFDAEGGEIVAKTRTLGTFALLEDTSAPRLSHMRPANGTSIANARPLLSVRVTDVGEKLDDEGVLFTLDGERLIPEYDPDAARIVARPKKPLAAGLHRIAIRLADKAGNETTLASSFTVTARRSTRSK